MVECGTNAQMNMPVALALPDDFRFLSNKGRQCCNPKQNKRTTHLAHGFREQGVEMPDHARHLSLQFQLPAGGEIETRGVCHRQKYAIEA